MRRIFGSHFFKRMGIYINVEIWGILILQLQVVSQSHRYIIHFSCCSSLISNYFQADPSKQTVFDFLVHGRKLCESWATGGTWRMGSCQRNSKETWEGSRWSRPHWGWRSRWEDPWCLLSNPVGLLLSPLEKVQSRGLLKKSQIICLQLSSITFSSLSISS